VRSRWSAILVSLLGTTAAACGPGSGDGPSEPGATTSDLRETRTYVATSVPWEEGEAPIRTVTVLVGDGRVTLSTGCNELSTYRAAIEGGVLRTEPLVGTNEECPSPFSEHEAWLGGLLSSNPSVVITDDRFELRSGDVSLVADASS
jgi:hypothetical protein